MAKLINFFKKFENLNQRKRVTLTKNNVDISNSSFDWMIDFYSINDDCIIDAYNLFSKNYMYYCMQMLQSDWLRWSLSIRH